MVLIVIDLVVCSSFDKLTKLHLLLEDVVKNCYLKLFKLVKAI